MHDRQKRINLLTRNNLGVTLKSDFIHSLSAALERQVDEVALLDLETTDQLAELVRSAYKSAKLDIEPSFVRYFSQSEHEKVFDLVTCLGDKLNKAPIFLLFRQSELCGAVSAESSTALAKARSLIGV